MVFPVSLLGSESNRSSNW